MEDTILQELVAEIDRVTALIELQTNSAEYHKAQYEEIMENVFQLQDEKYRLIYQRGEEIFK